ncbi:ATP-binding protein [Embleya sp. NPDC050493]|uniref:ATP-binding protein n=1 Tax=Embleya sp. NPDC050493 TaxID=3363989 RepID=UPI003792FCBC
MTGPKHDHARACTGGGPVEVLPFGASDLCLVRAVVRRHADAVGLADDRPDCLVLAVHEIAACAVTSGSKPALLRCVPRMGRVVCEIHASSDEHNGCRRRAFPRLTDKHETPGRGLWIARALCDEVEVAECAEGVVVRMTMHLTASTHATPPEPAGRPQGEEACGSAGTGAERP